MYEQPDFKQTLTDIMKIQVIIEANNLRDFFSYRDFAITEIAAQFMQLMEAAVAAKALGRALLRACEAIAAQEWAVDDMYLHARSDDDNLLSMYAKWGYDALPEFDQPGWLLAFAGR